MERANLTENCVTFTEKGLNFAESSENLQKKEVEIHKKSVQIKKEALTPFHTLIQYQIYAHSYRMLYIKQ